jgi:hypothetical protein
MRVLQACFTLNEAKFIKDQSLAWSEFVLQEKGFDAGDFRRLLSCGTRHRVV